MPDATIQAYRETLFIVQRENPIVLRIGMRNDSLLSLYRETQSACCAFLTACNPHSEPRLVSDVLLRSGITRIDTG